MKMFKYLKKKNSNPNIEEYVYEFIPYEKIGPIFLNKNDESLYKSGGVKYLQENAFNHVLCRPCFLDHPQNIKRGLNNERLIITIDKEKIKINCYYNVVLENFKKVADDFVEFDDLLDNGNLTKTAYSRKLGVIIFAIMDNNEYYIYSIRFLGKEQFEKSIQYEKSSSESTVGEENMEEFKINNNLSFEDDETKIEYQKYLDEINEYNKKIANGETPEKDLSEIAEEFKLKFKINNKTNSTDNTNNAINDKDEFDELVKKLNDNLKISETSNLDERLSQINNRISELDQQEKVEEIIISDLDLGNITINTITGKISCDKMKYGDKRLYNDFPIEYSISEIEIYDLKSCDLEECKNLLVDNLHFISDIKNEIEEKVIHEIWDWFSADFTPESLKQQFLKLCIKVIVCLYDGNYINLRTSWVFEEEHSDINSGYADFNVDINSKNIVRTDIGFY